MRKIPSTGNTNEIMPIVVNETADTGGASGSGHQSYGVPVQASMAITTSVSAIREVPEHHILQGHLGHAPCLV